MVTELAAYPAWLTRDDLPSGDQWEVIKGSAQRGDAWTNIDAKRMRVPKDNSALSRAIRCHELMHAKVSPVSLVLPAEFRTLDPNIVAAAEEVRVNWLSRRVGNDVDSLTDGTERIVATRMTETRDGAGLQHLIVSTFGTKVNDTIMRAIKTKSEELGEPKMYEAAKGLRRMLREQVRTWGYNPKNISSTVLRAYSDDASGVCPESDEDGYCDDDCEHECHTTVTYLPRGFHYTLRLAEYISNNTALQRLFALSDKPTRVDMDGAALPDGDRRFADLMIRKLPMPERVAGRLGRRRVATDIGTNPRRIHRHLTDPERRIFDKRVRGLGAVVLIDQSGSMHLSTDDLWEIIKSAPGATIIGYSHQPYSTDVPNCWVLAENGRVVSEVPSGNTGNGVDGPALIFALSKRKKGEPFIWVCDGQVTAHDDGPIPEGEVFCYKLVKKHNIHMVQDTRRAIEAIKKVAAGERLEANLTGSLSMIRRY